VLLNRMLLSPPKSCPPLSPLGLFVPAGKLSKGEKLTQVDHATMEYDPFRRRFYIEVPEIQRMSDEEVAQARKTEGIKVRSCWGVVTILLSRCCPVLP
jgi:hypothetical protein